MDHPTAMYHINTGNKFGGDPAMGSWVTYGLGTENENLPAFIVLPEVAYPQGGCQLVQWFSTGALSGHAAAAYWIAYLDIHPPPHINHNHQKEKPFSAQSI